MSAERLKWFGWYARLYRWSMRAIHAFGFHWFKDSRAVDETETLSTMVHMRWCHWCGERRIVSAQTSPRSVAASSTATTEATKPADENCCGFLDVTGHQCCVIEKQRAASSNPDTDTERAAR